MIITAEQIKAAVEALLKETFPGEPVYTDLVPEGFQRPSCMVELTGTELDALSCGRGAVGLRWQIRITAFCRVDEVHNAHLPELDLRAMAILAAFAQGSLRVGDRALRVERCAADTTLLDSAVVAVQLGAAADRAAFTPAELLPRMERLALRIKTNREDGT